MSPKTRRDFLATASAAGASMLLRSRAAAATTPFEGIFPIVQTPFKDTGALDTDTLANEVHFLHRMGVQGMTWPQNASEWSLLTADERYAGAEAIVKANQSAPAASRPAVVIGVQAATADAALPFARHARKIGADGIIAIPFNNGVGKDENKQIEYYSAIASSCSRPLVVQAIGDISVDLVLRLARQNPTIQYVKDEAGATLPRLTEYARHEQKLHGVFSGKHGPTFVEELARGACGNMPAAGFADLYVATWKAWNAGNVKEAEDHFSKTLLLILDAQTYGVPGQKYMLQLRGVFPNSKCRRDQSNAAFDDEARKAIARTVEYTKPWFVASR